MKDQDLREWIQKLRSTNSSGRKPKVTPAIPSASGGASSRSFWTSAGIFSDNVEQNELRASIPKLPAFATSKQLSTTTSEGKPIT
jgi:hypothetical protein